MRYKSILGGMGFLFGFLLMVTDLHAQNQATSFFTGVNPRQLNFQPVDVSKATKTYNMGNSFYKPKSTTSPTLGNFFPKISLGSWPPKVAQVSILPSKQNPYQPNPVQGINPFAPAKKK